MTIRKETASSFVLVMSGAFFLVYGLAYPVDEWANPGPGVFPLMVGSVWVILALVWFARSFRMPRPAEGTEGGQRGIHSIIRIFGSGKVEKKPLYMVVAFVIYLMMIRWVGFFCSTFLFVIVTSRLFGGSGWVRPIALSMGVNIFCYFLFEVWLKLSFPAGLLF